MVRHQKGQGMTEFALILPLLLLLLLGVVEAGRVIWAYITIQNAAREAARYASVAGRNDSGNLYFQDCNGIRNAASRVTFFQNVQNSDILIYYNVNGNNDGDGDPIFTQYCTPGSSVDSSVTLDTNDRVRVDVGTTFNTIVEFLPLEAGI